MNYNFFDLFLQVHSRVTGQDSQGRILTLEANQNLESKLFRLKKGKFKNAIGYIFKL